MNFSSEIYLDNSATTKPSDGVVKEIVKVLKQDYGNSFSVHAKGMASFEIIKNSKYKISKTLGCKEDEIYFTSGGTEANNLAIFGAIRSKKGKIVTTSIEHASVLEPLKKLQEKGYEVILVKPSLNEDVLLKRFEDAIDEETIFVSVMLVNNETGIVMPVSKIKKIMENKSKKSIFHTDASQAFCKIDINLLDLGADLVTVTAHKIHGPKGVGALFCSNRLNLRPIMFGGDQQNKVRPGTESTSLIAGFCKAVEEFDKNDCMKVKEICDYCKEGLLCVPNVVINFKNKNFPYILNVSVLGVKSEALINFLSSKNVFISNVSACHKNKKSYVLKAMGLSDELISSAVRISFSKFTTKEEITRFIKIFKETSLKLKHKDTARA